MLHLGGGDSQRMRAHSNEAYMNKKTYSYSDIHCPTLQVKA